VNHDANGPRGCVNEPRLGTGTTLQLLCLTSRRTVISPKSGQIYLDVLAFHRQSSLGLLFRYLLHAASGLIQYGFALTPFLHKTKSGVQSQGMVVKRKTT
jgi:hypothetical protein